MKCSICDIDKADHNIAFHCIDCDAIICVVCAEKHGLHLYCPDCFTARENDFKNNWSDEAYYYG